MANNHLQEDQLLAVSKILKIESKSQHQNPIFSSQIVVSGIKDTQN